ncbi:Protein of unknown function [Gryllus bimaculatus]|nr:Protein of unknown function [Gryllus bimaculatus]
MGVFRVKPCQPGRPAAPRARQRDQRMGQARCGRADGGGEVIMHIPDIVSLSWLDSFGAKLPLATASLSNWEMFHSHQDVLQYRGCTTASWRRRGAQK